MLIDKWFFTVLYLLLKTYQVYSISNSSLLKNYQYRPSRIGLSGRGKGIYFNFDIAIYKFSFE